MSIDNQGRDKGETRINKSNQRPKEQKPSPVTTQVNRTKDRVDKILKK